MGYLWLFAGVLVCWVVIATFSRAMVVTTEPPESGAFLRYVLHGLIAAVVVTMLVFVVRGGA